MSRLPRLLPYHPKPKKDELLSSWCTRIVNGYRMEISDFLDLLGMSSYLHSSDLDRIAPESLLRGLCEITGTQFEVAKQTVLVNKVRALRTDQIQIETVAWPWLIPIGRSRRFGRTSGYQICPTCLGTDQPYFRWQWAVALFSCCQIHGSYLVDRCTECSSSIHGSPQGILGARRTPLGAHRILLERCGTCGFDLRKLPTHKSSAALLEAEATYASELSSGEGSGASERFSVLRHLISLLYGDNRGLEAFRTVVSELAHTERVDIRLPYEPDVDIVPLEESDVVTRWKVILAAHWLMGEWPDRFLECCRKAQVQYPALNRNAISVRWYCNATVAAYGLPNVGGRRKPPASDREQRIGYRRANQAGKGS